MVAVGDLDKVWMPVREDVTPGELQGAFQSYFGAPWNEVLEAADKSFTYNAFNDAYFAVRNLHPVEDLTLADLLARTGIARWPNLIVS